MTRVFAGVSVVGTDTGSTTVFASDEISLLVELIRMLLVTRFSIKNPINSTFCQFHKEFVQYRSLPQGLPLPSDPPRDNCERWRENEFNCCTCKLNSPRTSISHDCRTFKRGSFRRHRSALEIDSHAPEPCRCRPHARRMRSLKRFGCNAAMSACRFARAYRVS